MVTTNRKRRGARSTEGRLLAATSASSPPAGRERPIIFSADSVRAILDGRKTQTRRVVDELLYIEIDDTDGTLRQVSQSDSGFGAACEKYARCPYGRPGDRLWVRETFALAATCEDPGDEGEGDWRAVYRADGDARSWTEGTGDDAKEIAAPWRSPIFMPRWASRLTLELTEVRVQRVQHITREDAVAEGMSSDPVAGHLRRDGVTELATIVFFDPVLSYRRGWNALNAKRGFSFENNPWVWALQFEVVHVRLGQL
jgi:hypothetical protein